MSFNTLPPKRFLCVLFGALVFFCSPLLVSYRYLRQYGETLSPSQIVDELQSSPDTYYRSAMHDNLRETALEILRRRQPEVIALGSSLSFDFREEYFTSSFGCGCGVMDSASEGELFVDELIQVIQPKIVLFTLDFWWFSDPVAPQRPGLTPVSDAPLFSFSKLCMPFKQIQNGEITIAEFFGFTPILPTPGIEKRPVGLMATLESVGRRPDGSQFNGKIFTDQAWDFYAPVRKRLASPLEFVMTPGRFGPDLAIHEDRIETIRRAIKKLQAHGAHVILIYPPMAPSMVSAMEKSGHHDHFFKLPQKLEALGTEFYDFHAPDSVGIEPGEFADTHHAGNTAYMRLLTAILKRNPTSPLSQIVDQDKLEQWIQNYRGTTVAVFEHDRIRVAETNFLGLDLAKPHSTQIKKTHSEK